MTRTPFLRSKTFLYLLAFAMIAAAWQWATWHLYSLPEYTIAAHVTITTQALWGIVALALALAGVKGVMEAMSMRLGISTGAQTVASVAKTEITERIYNCKKLDPKDVDGEDVK